MTQTQQYHHFDQAGIYVGSTPVDHDPRHPELTMPPPYGATLTSLPVLAEREAAKVRPDGGWDVVPDWRGFTYWTAQRVKHVIDVAEQVPPEGALTADPGPTAEQVSEQLVLDAQDELIAADKVATRCFKAGKAYPANWRARDELLREIVRTGAGSIPAALDYPAGT